MTAEDRDPDRRRRLLDAALAAFGTQGHAATTIEGAHRARGVRRRLPRTEAHPMDVLTADAERLAARGLIERRETAVAALR